MKSLLLLTDDELAVLEGSDAVLYGVIVWPLRLHMLSHLLHPT